MKARSQLLLSEDFEMSLVHGGEYSVGKRKKSRPVTTKRPMHITMRSSEARGKLSFRHARNLAFIRNLLPHVARKWGIKIYQLSINGNHLHFLLKASHRKGFQNFMRVVSAQIATFVTGAKKGKPFGKRFWDLPAFSRVVEWGKAFGAAKRYVIQNVLETLGVIDYRPRQSEKRTKKCKSEKKWRSCGAPESGA